MKVLITCDLFPPEIHGGTEVVAYNIAKTLVKNGYKVEVICLGDPKIKLYNSIKTHRINLRKWFLANILLIPTIYKFAKRADIIHNITFDTSIASSIVAKLLHKPLIMSIMGVYGSVWVEMRKSWIAGKIRAFFERLQLRLLCDELLFVSEQSRNLGIKLGAAKQKSKVIVPAVNWKKFKRRKKEPFVLFVGRLVPQKGLKYLIQASKRLPKINFKIVGEGPERTLLEKISPPNVEFLGHVSDKKLSELYSKALIFCLPSLREGLGIVLLEAMAAGCAIISTVPFDYSGFTVQPRDSIDLAKKIKYLLQNKDLALKMGRENKEKVKRYKWEDILSIYEKYKYKLQGIKCL